MRFALAALLIVSCAPRSVPCPLPPTTPPPVLREQPGFTVHRCAASQDTLVVERAGTRPATDDDIQRFKERHAGELLLDGITGVGLGGCCASEGPRLCLVIYAEAETAGATALLPALDRLVGQDGMPELSLPAVVYVSGPRRPRCAASDPACGPVGYDHQCTASGSLSQPRIPLGRVDLDPRNTCTTDGECMPNGCGNQCTSYHQGNQAGTCEYALTLEAAWCGCVRGRCGWFQ
jgi:hypothetical protein